ncbi:MAG: hypothetical protein ABFS56_18725 [Pseudomonadota bacterium]
MHCLTSRTGLQTPSSTEVRINSLAATLIVEYNGKTAIKQNIIDWCANISKKYWPRVDATENITNGTELSSIIGSGLALALLPFLLTFSIQIPINLSHHCTDFN